MAAVDRDVEVTGEHHEVPGAGLALSDDRLARGQLDTHRARVRGPPTHARPASRTAGPVAGLRSRHQARVRRARCDAGWVWSAAARRRAVHRRWRPLRGPRRARRPAPSRAIPSPARTSPLPPTLRRPDRAIAVGPCGAGSSGHRRPGPCGRRPPSRAAPARRPGPGHAPSSEKGATPGRSRQKQRARQAMPADQRQRECGADQPADAEGGAQVARAAGAETEHERREHDLKYVLRAERGVLGGEHRERRERAGRIASAARTRACVSSSSSSSSPSTVSTRRSGATISAEPATTHPKTTSAHPADRRDRA